MIATLVCFASFIIFNTANLLYFGIFNQADPICDQSAIIIFVITHREYRCDILTFDYIVKPVKQEDLEKVCNRIFEYYNHSDRYFTFSQNCISHIIILSEICYFEKYGQSIEVFYLLMLLFVIFLCFIYIYCFTR